MLARHGESIPVTKCMAALKARGPSAERWQFRVSCDPDEGDTGKTCHIEAQNVMPLLTNGKSRCNSDNKRKIGAPDAGETDTISLRNVTGGAPTKEAETACRAM